MVLLILVISYASSLRIYLAQTREIAATEAAIADRQARIAELQGELAQWDDTAHVKTQARARLGWVVPGETGFTVVGEDGRPLGGGADIAADAAPLTAPTAWWTELWGSVEAADAPPPPPAPAKKKQPAITEDTEADRPDTDGSAGG